MLGDAVVSQPPRPPQSCWSIPPPTMRRGEMPVVRAVPLLFEPCCRLQVPISVNSWKSGVDWAIQVLCMQFDVDADIQDI